MEPLLLAFFQKRPRINVETTGGQMYANTFCKYTQSELAFSIIGAQAEARTTRINVAICPARTSCLLVISGRICFTKSIVMRVEAELKVAETEDIIAANRPASTKPSIPVGSSLNNRTG